jgi:hypothetical protein
MKRGKTALRAFGFATSLLARAGCELFECFLVIGH